MERTVDLGPTGRAPAEAGDPEREVDRDRVQPGTRIGRYEVRTTLGQGGMGVVLLAHDEALERYVAIKLVRHRARSRSGDTLARDRLLREAQAMARLSHPNVITVHDVGTYGERVFVAMEHVQGATLSVWLDERARSIESITRVFVGAARGLAAAHQAGLVHRDFKPDNVMVADDGRVLVLDFGLARAADGPVSSAGASASGAFTLDGGATPLTMPGWVMGTPAYMAPEQHHGDASPASDQFAFCVALYEALYGARPFGGRTLEELAQAKKDGIVGFPPDIAVPRTLTDALRRGLSASPRERYASMLDLVDALEGGPRRRSRQRGIMAGFAGLAIVAGGLAAMDPAGADPCSGSGSGAGAGSGSAAALAGAWDAERRAAVQAGLAAAPSAYAKDTSDTVLGALDAYADALVDARERTCRATRVEHTQTESELDARMGCLARRRHDLAAVVDVLASADAETVQHAVDTALGLPPVASCDEATGSARAEPTSADEAAKLDALHDLASKVTALTMAGRYPEAKEAIARLLSESEALARPALVAEAQYLHAELLHRTGEYEPAREAYLRALDAAADANDDRIAARAWDGLAFCVGHSLAQLERAEGYARHLEATVLRLGSPTDLEAGLQQTLGILAHDGGRLPDARAHFEKAVALREELGDETELAAVLVNLARTMQAQGEIEPARKVVERAVATMEARYGPSHPQVAKTLTYLGGVEFEAGDVDAAAKRYERALAIQQETLPADHPEVAFSLNNVANVLGTRGELEPALDHYRRARDILQKRLGDEHPNVARLTFNMAELCKLMGQPDAAMTEYRRAIDLFEKAFGPDHPDVGRALNNLASVQYDEHQYDESLKHYAASLAVVEKALGPDNPSLGYPLTGLGLVHIADGRPAEAIAPLERSLKLRAADDVDPVDRGDTQYALARALWAADLDKTRALELAKEAIAQYAHAAEGVRTNRDDALAWLADRGERGG
jgi:tetratricopeptide (TPR) repeat protein/predicted Ser/Thr protein kinase